MDICRRICGAGGASSLLRQKPRVRPSACCPTTRRR